jgi:Poly A polymerase head domain
MNQIISPNELTLPLCPFPRPGEKVVYYSDARPIIGELRGHDQKGNAIIFNQFGTYNIKSFEAIRPHAPLQRHEPNWHYLPSNACLYRPTEEQQKHLDELLNKRISPGPKYIELFYEIWARGFEVFLVGGTVRDVVCRKSSNDIDIVTTMPLRFLRNVVGPMYHQRERGNDKRGYIRIGGTPNSGDPFIDLKVFSDSQQGTSDATFGVDIKRDALHRDFACNSLYYDPINRAIIDPFGHGLKDAQNSELNLVCDTGVDRQMAQIFIRIIKFNIRGFVISEDTESRMKSRIIECIPTMTKAALKQYVATQILSKYTNDDEKVAALDSFREFFSFHHFDELYAAHFKGIVSEIEGELRDG